MAILLPKTLEAPNPPPLQALNSPQHKANPDHKNSLAYGIGAFIWWGLIPVYYKFLHAVPALEITAHRIIWSVVFLLVLMALRRQLHEIPQLWQGGVKRILGYALTASLIAGNWGVFIWAINAGRIIETSLGYYLNPMIMVLFGVIFLGERLRFLQILAIFLAGFGVLVMVFKVGYLPWVSLVLATSWGAYSLIRKQFGLDPLRGLLAETLVLLPFSLAWLAFGHNGAPLVAGQEGLGIMVLLSLSGPATTVPLLWFMRAASGLRLATLGLLQYIAPSLSFLIAVFLYGETFTSAHALTFTGVWAGIFLYSLDGWRQAQRGKS
jgi:chloramphenicol-sensitive protein RarD